MWNQGFKLSDGRIQFLEASLPIIIIIIIISITIIISTIIVIIDHL